MKSALVTGASAGIGRATALRLDRAGWRVFAGVRGEEDAPSTASSPPSCASSGLRRRSGRGSTRSRAG
ncbi:MAG TPA: SDR family NAD(P)-dependent oxidoreductase [Solirubrobacterales bacterium]|nr:SDR family NAD(P)-dependent oxidoreductase [Solirubrobacterales bacterium]